MTELITGIAQTLLIDLTDPTGAPYNLTSPDAAVTVQATLISTDRASTLVGPITLSSGTTGASWATGRVAVPLTVPNLTALGSAKVVQAEVKAVLTSGAVIDWPRVVGGITVTKGTIP